MLKSTIMINQAGDTVTGFHHCEYYSMYDDRNKEIYSINMLKNDRRNLPRPTIAYYEEELANILKKDFARLSSVFGSFTVCGVPRSKAEVSYPWTCMGLKRAISAATDATPGFENGLNYIVRHTDTCTTHRARSGYGGAGMMPYPGITMDTCSLSNEIAGKDILLVDDIYTRTCGIDEDAVRALLARGAKSVTFYSLGYTVYHKQNYGLCA